MHLETLQTFSTTRQSSQKKRSTQILCYQWTWTLLLTSLSCRNRIFQFSTNQIWKSTATVTIFSFPTNLLSKLIKSKLKRSHQYCQRFENFKLRKMARSILPLSKVLKKRTNCSTIKSKTYRCRKSSKTPSASSSFCVQVILMHRDASILLLWIDAFSHRIDKRLRQLCRTKLRNSYQKINNKFKGN